MCIVKDDTDLPSPFASSKKITWYLFLSLAFRLAKIKHPLNVIREAAVKFMPKENQKSDLTFWFLLAETSLP